ncbi:MAG: hypothetical protein ACYC42_12005, partial [Lysobacter sp.]
EGVGCCLVGRALTGDEQAGEQQGGYAGHREFLVGALAGEVLNDLRSSFWRMPGIPFQQAP